MTNDMNAVVKNYGEVTLKIYPDRKAMGAGAAKDAADALRRLLAEKDEVNALFAAAPSQSEFLAALALEPGIEWERVNALHMDEYMGLPADSSALFRVFLDEAIFKRVVLKKVYYVDDPEVNEDITERYRRILKENPLDIVFMGIGENGHIAFNDPPVADFDDPVDVKVVDLDLVSRQQQVHDKTFPDLDSVPKQAYTVTIPPMIKARERFCIVPSALKAMAVKAALEGPVDTACPASILRTVKTSMYIDRDAASLLDEEQVKP